MIFFFDTRKKGDFRCDQHRLNIYKRFPSVPTKARIILFNRLPESLEVIEKIKTNKKFFVAKKFISLIIDEFSS